MSETPKPTPAERSACCNAELDTDYYGDMCVPGGTVSWACCSKCGRPHHPRYDEWEANQK